MKENIKLGLLGVIAVTLVINTYLQIPSKTEKSRALKETSDNPIADDGHGHNASNPTSTPFVSSTPEPSTPTGPVTSIQFAQTAHNYGKIKQDTKNKYTFKFKNTGSNPLIIENAVGSCGCTVPDYPKEPIAPGATSQIVVEYSPGKQQGLQNKTVTVTANTEPKQTVLNISADVEVIP